MVSVTCWYITTYDESHLRGHPIGSYHNTIKRNTSYSGRFYEHVIMTGYHRSCSPPTPTMAQHLLCQNGRLPTVRYSVPPIRWGSIGRNQNAELWYRVGWHNPLSVYSHIPRNNVNRYRHYSTLPNCPKMNTLSESGRYAIRMPIILACFAKYVLWRGFLRGDDAIFAYFTGSNRHENYFHPG